MKKTEREICRQQERGREREGFREKERERDIETAGEREKERERASRRETGDLRGEYGGSSDEI